MDKMLTYVLTCIVLSAFLAVGRSTAPRRPFRSAKAPKGSSEVMATYIVRFNQWLAF